MLTTIKDLSVVQLNDGRKGTVVNVYDDHAYLVEIDDDTHDLVDVALDQVESVIWEP